MPDETLKKHLTEDVLGEFGFRLCWEVVSDPETGPYWVNVRAYAVASIGGEDDDPCFEDVDRNHVASTDEARTYLEGFVKWDGCCEMNQGCPHWCRIEDLRRHAELLEYVYRRALALMGRSVED